MGIKLTGRIRSSYPKHEYSRPQVWPLLTCCVQRHKLNAVQFSNTAMYKHNASPRAAELVRTSNGKDICSTVFYLYYYKGWSLRATGKSPPSDAKPDPGHTLCSGAQCHQPLSPEQMPSQGEANQSQVPTAPALSLPGFINQMSKAH